MVDVETAVTRLYEDESLTEDLYDPEASQLLRWAEGLVTQWAQQYARDDDFEARFKPLRAYIRRVSLLVGKRAELSDEKRQEVCTKLIENAQEMGVMVAQSQAQSLTDELEALEDSDAVQMFIRLASARIEQGNGETLAEDAASAQSSADDTPTEADSYTDSYE